MGHNKRTLAGKARTNKSDKNHNTNGANVKISLEHDKQAHDSKADKVHTNGIAKHADYAKESYAKTNGILHTGKYTHYISQTNGNLKHTLDVNGNTIQPGGLANGHDGTAHPSTEENKHNPIAGGDGGVGGVTNVPIFPRWTPWLVFAFTLVFRLWYVSDRANWWILHPDEVYQTLEVAHSEVYGYGFRAYEYLPPPTNSSLTTTNPARTRELELGMYSLRSFILANAIAVVMFLLEETGVAISPFLVGKLFHVCISSLLPVAVFQFTQTLYESRDVAAVSCILAASSTLLNLFGTHSLINSFLSPFVFFSLTSFVRLLKQRQEKSTMTAEGIHDNSRHRQMGHPWTTRMSGFTIYNNVSHDKLTVSIVTIVSHIMVHLHWLQSLLRYDCLCYSDMISGLCLVLCVYMRADIALLPVFLGMCYCKLSCRHIRNKLFDFRFFISGFTIGALIGGFEDFRSYGVWFISPVQWLKFNVLHNSAAVVFGESPFMFYVWNVVMFDLWHVALFLLLVIDVSIDALITRSKRIHKSKGNNSVVYTVCVLTAIYSLNGHKEPRFFQHVLVIMYVLYSRAIIRLYNAAVIFLNQNDAQYYVYIFYSFIILFSSSQFHTFVTLQNANTYQWTINGEKVTSHVNACLDFIRQQNDVTGVFMEGSIHTTGGYSVLHKNVPVIARMRNEFFEFGLGFRHNVQSTSLYTSNQSLSLFSSPSDYIVTENREYLSKLLIKAPKYNYLIISSNQHFIANGYKEVFRYGDSKVLHRLTDIESKTYLDKIGIDIPLGRNATILEFEAHALLQHGVYNRTELKLLYGNRLDESRLGIYQLLMELYRKFTGVYSVDKIFKACTHLHSAHDCLGRYIPVSLT